MTFNKKKLQMPTWLGILLMPFMIVFSGIGLVAYVTTMSLTVLAVQAVGVVMAGHTLLHRILYRAPQPVSNR